MRILLVIIAILLLLPGRAIHAQETHTAKSLAVSEQVTVYVFWSQTCPHCGRAKSFLEALVLRDPAINLQSHEISSHPRHERAFVALTNYFGVSPPSVPLIVVGEEVFVGYDDDATTGAEIKAAIHACRPSPCRDVAGGLIRSASMGTLAEDQKRVPGRAGTRQLPETVRLPLIGDIELKTLSLPALTIVLGAVDGFNPCAMWVLVFLIGLLVGMQDAVRMWSYGAVFLLTSAAVYFAFMTAWLNLFLLLGSLVWIRVGVGLFALAAAGYYLYQFFANAEATCAVAAAGERQRIMTRLKQAVAERSFLMAVAGIVVLAVAVNLIELLCSAGIPAVYTQVLALSELEPAAYYSLLALYILVFLLDDAVVFVTAMVTLRATGLTASYAHYSHLIGGVVLGGVGLLLLFRPGWLAFV